MTLSKFAGPRREKTRFAVTQNGFSRCGGGKYPLHELFESFACHELNGLRGLDLDLFASLWVHTRASFAAGNFESSKTNELNALGLLNTDFDTVDNGIHGALCVSFAGAESFLNGFDEGDFVAHWYEK